MRYFLGLLISLLLFGCGGLSTPQLVIKSIPPPVPAGWNAQTYYEKEVAQVTSQRLQDEYEANNLLYFDNRLVPAKIGWDWKAQEEGDLGVTYTYNQCNHPEIVLNPKMAFSERIWTGVLLHEMMHIYVDCVLKKDSGGTVFSLGMHSREFHRQMRKLICKGAFDDLGYGCVNGSLSTPDEKESGWPNDSK